MDARVYLSIAALAALAMVAAPSAASAQQERKTHRIVFEVTSGDSQVWDAVLNNIENVRKAFGAETTDIRVVAHGKGIELVRKSNTAAGDRVAALSGPNVQFVACENTMRRLKVEKADLLPAASTVDSGVAEVVRLQEAGWAYIKSGS